MAAARPLELRPEGVEGVESSAVSAPEVKSACAMCKPRGGVVGRKVV